jgi:hypothetical protein
VEHYTLFSKTPHFPLNQIKLPLWQSPSWLVPIWAKMDIDDENHTDFQFGSSQESKIDPPIVLDSVWDCLGITLDTFVDGDGKTIPD